jgi:hypothetical protein
VAIEGRHENRPPSIRATRRSRSPGEAQITASELDLASTKKNQPVATSA